MAKKQNKKTKEVPICSDCLKDTNDSDLKDYMFFWVLQHNDEQPSMDYYTLFCINCIEKHDMIIGKPYVKKKGRPKGSKNKKSD